MIRHQSNLILVENRTADFIEFIDGRRPGNIIGQGQIHLGNQQFPFFHFRPAGMAGQDFLRSCHSHSYDFLSFAPKSPYLLQSR